MTNISEVMIFIGTVCHRGFFLVTCRVNSKVLSGLFMCLHQYLKKIPDSVHKKGNFTSSGSLNDFK